MEKLSRLVEKLLERSERGLVSWQASADDRAFQFSAADSSVVITKIRSDSYQMIVLNSEGQIVDSFSNRELDRSIPNIEDKKFSNAMERLFELARRKALRADEAVDGLLAALGD